MAEERFILSGCAHGYGGIYIEYKGVSIFSVALFKNQYLIFEIIKEMKSLLNNYNDRICRSIHLI